MINETEAIDLATRIVTDRRGDSALAGRRAVAEVEGEAWHVYFPWKDPEMLGGEPHVLLDASEGRVIRVFSTQ